MGQLFRSKQRHEPILRYCLSIIGMPLPYFLSADQKKQRISYCTIIASSKQAFNKASPELLGLSTFPNATCRGSRVWAFVVTERALHAEKRFQRGNPVTKDCV